MSDHKKTTELTAFLASIAETKREEAIQLTKESFNSTEANKIAQSVSDYLLVSKRAKDLVKQISNINFNKTSPNQLNQAYSNLKRLTEEFKRLVNSSNQSINQGSYQIDLISRGKLKETNPRLQKLIRVFAASNDEAPVEAFRKHLKMRKDPIVQTEYFILRSIHQERKDQSYSENYLTIAGLVGLFIAIVIANSLIPYQEIIEYTLLSTMGIIFLLGLFRLHPFLRYFANCIVIFYIVGIIMITLLQTMSESFLDLNVLEFRGYHQTFLIGLVGMIIATFVSKFTNGLFEPECVRSPYKLQFVDQKIIMLTILFGLYSVVWYHAFSSQNTIYMALSNYVNEVEVVVAEERVEPVGKIVVTANEANVRTEPLLGDEYLFTQLEGGMELYYYGTFKDDRGKTWYKLRGEADSEDYWIHEINIKIID